MSIRAYRSGYRDHTSAREYPIVTMFVLYCAVLCFVVLCRVVLWRGAQSKSKAKGDKTPPPKPPQNLDKSPHGDPRFTAALDDKKPASGGSSNRGASASSGRSQSGSRSKSRERSSSRSRSRSKSCAASILRPDTTRLCWSLTCSTLLPRPVMSCARSARKSPIVC
jgi:hypothetical protein